VNNHTGPQTKKYADMFFNQRIVSKQVQFGGKAEKLNMMKLLFDMNARVLYPNLLVPLKKLANHIPERELLFADLRHLIFPVLHYI
jgi:hypothetical protein